MGMRSLQFQNHLLSLFKEAVENYPDLEIDFIKDPLCITFSNSLLVKENDITFLIGGDPDYSSSNTIFVYSIAYLDRLLPIKNKDYSLANITEYRDFKANNRSFQQILDKARKVFDFSREYYKPKKSFESINELKHILIDVVDIYKEEIKDAKKEIPKIFSWSIDLPDENSFPEIIEKLQNRIPLNNKDKKLLKKAILAYRSGTCDKSALLYVLELDKERNENYPWEI